jgi:hypothetical protein
MGKKRLSGAQWRKRRKQGLTSGKRGRPQGPVKLIQLWRDIAHGLWEDPDWPVWPDEPANRFSVSWLLSPQGALARHRLMCVLRERWPERYRHLSDSTLSRYIGAVLLGIWDQREDGRGANIRAKTFPSLNWSEQSKDTV